MYVAFIKTLGQKGTISKLPHSKKKTYLNLAHSFVNPQNDPTQTLSVAFCIFVLFFGLQLLHTISSLNQADFSGLTKSLIEFFNTYWLNGSQYNISYFFKHYFIVNFEIFTLFSINSSYIYCIHISYLVCLHTIWHIHTNT